MSTKRFGAQSSELQLQPNWSITPNVDGTITGQCSFRCEESDALSGGLIIGRSKHPKDERLELLSFTITGDKQTKCLITCDYFGLSASPTKPIYSFYNAASEEPIESHPKFAQLAGTKDAPLNDAIFDTTTGAFYGFPATAGASLAGVRGYLSSKPTIRKTFYSDNALEGAFEIDKIKNIANGEIPGLPFGDKVLVVNGGNNQIGNFYQIWQEYAIPGENGWNDTIYKSTQ